MPERKACRIRLLPEAHPGGQERAVQAMQLSLQVSEEVLPAGSEGRQEGRVSNHQDLDIRALVFFGPPKMYFAKFWLLL